MLIRPHAGGLVDGLSPLGIEVPDRAAVERAHSVAVRALDTLPAETQIEPGTYVKGFVNERDVPTQRAVLP